MMKVKQGDLDKLGLLFERYNRPLYSYFYRMSKEVPLSQDLVQSVFERMLKYRNTYSGTGAFTTWMFSIARNAHIDHYRRIKRNGETGHLNEDQLEMAPPEYGEQDDLNSKKILLEKALDLLEEDKREVIILSRYEGLKYQEIADIQETTEGAIKVKMFRAMKELKDVVLKLSEDCSK
ncbi:MAG: RNA polymerase sigma factor [Balneolaceae bacterium]